MRLLHFAATAELGDDCAALVCTEGVPSAACHRLLGDAARGNPAALARRLRLDRPAHHRGRRGTHPWRMTAADYTSALDEGESTPLSGPPATSPWDRGLALAMKVSGSAVMEERLLPALLSDLAGT